jgi:serine/threonine protein kinase
MAFLSKHRIVHRDLAARNILVAAHDWVKISDFGLARYLNPENNYYYIQDFNRKLPAPW